MNNRGFTYVEIVISILILGMLMPMMINIFRFIHGESKRQRDALSFSYILQGYIEEKIALPLSLGQENDPRDREEYSGYYFEHSISPYWNGYTDVAYYIVDQLEGEWQVITYGVSNESSHIVVNGMMYELDQDIYIESEGVIDPSRIVMYCTRDNRDKIHIRGIEDSDITKIVDNSSREYMLFKMTVSVFEHPADEIPIISIDTLYERGI